MKKIVLLPKTDTVTLCLPEQWVGVPVICKLMPIFEQHINFDDIELEVERVIVFRNKQRRKKKK
jgi:hypothetical protein